jgi:hypothetical protein
MNTGPHGLGQEPVFIDSGLAPAGHPGMTCYGVKGGMAV